MQAEAHTGPPKPPFDPGPLAALLGGSTAGVGVLDTHLRFLYVNPALERINGIPASAHLGRTVTEVFPELDAGANMMRAVLDDGHPREVTSSGQTRAPSESERRYWRGAYHRIEENGQVRGIVVLVLEISDAQHQREELERARGQLALLDTAAVSIGTTLDMDTTCRELADFVVPELADMAAVEVFPPEVGHAVRQPPPGVLRLRRAALAATPALAGAADQFGTAGDYIDYPEGSAVARCLAANGPVVEDFWSDDKRAATRSPSSVPPPPARSVCTRRSSCRWPRAGVRWVC